MLKQRVITALILVAILLPTLAAQAAWPFAILTLVFISAAGWEWSRLNEAPGARAVMMGAAVAGACLFVAQSLGLSVWGAQLSAVSESVGHVHGWGHPLVGFATPAVIWLVAVAVWVPGGAAVLRFGTEYWKQVPQLLRRLLGLGLLMLAWLALVESKAQGLNYLLSVFCLVWAADIGAYFGGRAFGKNKLAPSISPGKSWEGVWSGMLAVALLSVIWIWIDRNIGVDAPSLYSRLLMGLGPAGMLVALAFLAAMSVVGDLFESLIKRQAGAKDSSQLLPGHGGVLDRIDALLPVLPLSLALMTLCHG
ncbi:phosphatidate cytidylyltransferase [Aquabacterium sp. NJ1]|uniref:phosphatidate cytidylyltransferase n=1 Tax=Aquabacterium sp. NJ1 TaxID=1538295 RepID=UPI00052B6E74|nr:phosphatidate cytidylyltransferase [Aquabacterium sp. NJ1]KGM39229.1 phosphatidate cytidylyltransferase [Aquabacterium sp. NJ1]